MSRFKTARKDGRSDADVILDLARDKTPGVVLEYGDLIEALSVGSEHTYTVKDVQVAKQRAYPRLLREQARALQNVPKKGYRIALAGQHSMLAGRFKTKADRSLHRGVITLQHVRWDEMDANQRLAHEGSLLILGGLYEQMKGLERRQAATEEAIRKLRSTKNKQARPGEAGYGRAG